ncbi:methyl-accepting chemotaxis protein, partial [Pseudomonas syringae]
MEQGVIASVVNMNSTGILAIKNAMVKQIKDLTNLNNEGVERAGQTATDLYNNSLWLDVDLITGVFILTIGSALLLTKSITSPINDALSVAERIADSDLSKEVLASGPDEAGRVLKALAQMQTDLRHTILQISDVSTQLASAIEELNAFTEKPIR